MSARLPKASIPQPSVERLSEVGEWLRVNSEAVYGAGPSPFPYELPWGMITTKPGKLYLHVFDWPQEGAGALRAEEQGENAYLLANKSKLESGKGMIGPSTIMR